MIDSLIYNDVYKLKKNLILNNSKGNKMEASKFPFRLDPNSPYMKDRNIKL